MNVLWHIDGMDRQQWEEEGKIAGKPAILEESYPALMSRVVAMSEGVRFFNTSDCPDGYWSELLRYQPLVVLAEIKGMNTQKLEKEYLKQELLSPEKIFSITSRLIMQMDEWEKRMIYYPDLKLAAVLKNRKRWKIVPEEEGKKKLKRIFYSLLETVRELQESYDVYLEEIRNCGKNDPSVALLDVFLRNYSEIIGRFNARWEEWPSFYYRRILHAHCRGILPDHTWLNFQKMPGAEPIVIPKGTGFIAGKNADGSLVYYQSEETITVSDIRLCKIRTFYPEKDQERYPAARLGFVTAVLGKELDVESGKKASRLFGGEDSYFEPMGLLAESPVFLLREGKRCVTLTFQLTEKSTQYLLQLITEIAEGQEESRNETEYKLLKDAFHLSISTEEGWSVIPEYTAAFRDEGFIVVNFRLNEEFPATQKAHTEVHGRTSAYPVFRIFMNREAWLFPYSWAIHLECKKLCMKVDVSGISSVKLYGTIGEFDTSVPFYPFGVQPEKGARIIFGNYEMALKSLSKVELICHWQQLPVGPEGFYGHYREYGLGIDNTSFQVRTEWLCNKKWRSGKESVQFLFEPSGKEKLNAFGRIPENTHLLCLPEEVRPVTVREENYIYGSVSDGFCRVILEAPEMGFGHTLYRQLFAEISIANSRRKHPLPEPAPPVSPLLDGLELHYEAEEEVGFGAGQSVGRTRLFHIGPNSSSDDLPLAADQPFTLVESSGDVVNLLLGFKDACGNDRIRFYIETLPLLSEVEVDNEKMNSPVWYMNKFRKWEALGVDALVRDTTGGWVNNGLIEIALPSVVKEDWLDEEGIFWLLAVFPADIQKQVRVRNWYTNVVEVVTDCRTVREDWPWSNGLPKGCITSAASNLPGIAAITQIVPGKGGRQKEDEDRMKNRVRQRIAHRNRAVNSDDYEHFVLDRFPQVEKVKCLPGLDSKGKNRQGIVTLVVVRKPQWQAGVSPSSFLCSNELLTDVENFIRPLTDSWVLVDAINIQYEEVTVRCCIVPEKGVSVGELIRRLKEKLDVVIAPWKKEKKAPEFGYGFTLQALAHTLLEDEGVAALRGISLLHVSCQEKRHYTLKEYRNEAEKGEKIKASCPWGIMLPATEHLVDIGTEWEREAGIGKLGMEKTFVIS